MINNICALVVCYKDYEATNTCVKAIIKQTISLKKIYVVDNTEKPELSNEIYSNKKVSVLSQSKNLGISGAYILAFKQALKDGMDWCWTFDQDSKPKPLALEEIINNYQYIKAPKIGIIASTGISIKDGRLYKGNNASWLRFKKPNLRRSVYKCDLVISAGSLTNLHYFKEYGYSFEDMFIDWVDFEICCDMTKNNYGVYSCQTSFFEHYIGGSEVAQYAESDTESEEISNTRLTHLVRNSIKVILKSNGFIKYPYLVYFMYKLKKDVTKQQNTLFWSTTKEALKNNCKLL